MKTRIMGIARQAAWLLASLLLPGIAPAQAQPVGPAAFFDMQAVRDESTLAPVISRDAVVPSRARPGKRVRVIELRFTSQDWKGLSWTHPARIYVPDDYQGGGHAGIIGTERQFFGEPAWPRHTIPGTGLNTEAEYAEGTAIDLGMPVMLFSNPAEDYWGMNESDLTGYALKQVMETGDLTWNGYYPIAMAYLRAITLMHNLPGVRTERAVLMGCSKRGFAVSIATGVDPDRVAGVMATCYYGGNSLYFLARKYAEFGPGVGGPAQQRTGPGFQPADAVLRTINNPTGFRMLTHFDPYMWRKQVRSSFLVALGTNDEFFALGTPNSMLTEMSGDKAFLAVDNLPHSCVSAKHLAAWRMWLAHTFLGRKLPAIEASGVAQGGQFAVQASVRAEAAPADARLYYAYNPVTADWRKARWESVPMRTDGEMYAAGLPLRDGYRLAYYVEVEDEGTGGKGFVSSLVNFAN
ncbi:PhoPQ-activated protein PqaA family protein [Cupriavidus sp. BIC8F]|uniref:PhoPQ-activated protein PqaA family protein n=1 Tax=Cupriavidus sp. BIC8F TaxID=3079014 RepID=UPI0029167416|nr:PhoPQ-activated protein PqaA family protein [Cupriavidus sp. BIC8F]